MRRIVIAMAGAVIAVLASLFPATVATAAPVTSPHAGCSASYLFGDYRLGPAATPDRGPIGRELIGYQRFAGTPPQRFLDRYWNPATSSWRYPPDSGFLIIRGKPVEFRLTLEPGEPLDRYGSPYGSFLSPAGTLYATRSIPPSNLDDSPGFTCNYHLYTVLRAFTVEAGLAAPAFGQPGLGLQYQLLSSLLPGHPAQASVYWLIEHGYLAASR